MPRQVRIEFPGAFYHVMARGDRREAIFIDDTDRLRFLETLGEACLKTGWRVHSFVLMGNHYHFLVETPEANLSAGMHWFQGTYTIRFNHRHGLKGHLFGERYRAVLVQSGSGPYFETLIDYIHLNPVRAGLVGEGRRIEAYAWSSLPCYLAARRDRPVWLTAADGLAACGCPDTPTGRRRYLKALHQRISLEESEKAGIRRIEGQGLQSTLHRGWYYGDKAFRQSLLDRLAESRAHDGLKAADGYNGLESRDHSEADATRLVAAGLEVLGVERADLSRLRKNDWRKALIAHLVRTRTCMTLDWVSGQLDMGARGPTCRNTVAMGHRLAADDKLRRLAEAIVRRAKRQ